MTATAFAWIQARQAWKAWWVGLVEERKAAARRGR